jgi:hypothetical protein
VCWQHLYGDILEKIPASVLRVSEWLLPQWDGMLGESAVQGNHSSEVNWFGL